MSLNVANGLLIVVCVLQQTINDVPCWTVFWANPWDTPAYRYRSIGPYYVSPRWTVVRGFFSSVHTRWRWTLIFGSLMSLPISCVGGHPALLLSSCSIHRLRSKRALSRANSKSDKLWSSWSSDRMPWVMLIALLGNDQLVSLTATLGNCLGQVQWPEVWWPCWLISSCFPNDSVFDIRAGRVLQKLLNSWAGPRQSMLA